MKLKTWLYRWLPFVLWAAAIFFISANPNPYRSIPQGGLVAEELETAAQASGINLNGLLSRAMHPTEYALLAVLAMRGWAWNRRPNATDAMLGLGICMLYAFGDEFHQLFIPGRTFQLRDLGFDLAGSIMGVSGFLILKRWGWHE